MSLLQTIDTAMMFCSVHGVETVSAHKHIYEHAQFLEMFSFPLLMISSVCEIVLLIPKVHHRLTYVAFIVDRRKSDPQ